MFKYKDISDLIEEAIEDLQNIRSAVQEMAAELDYMKASMLLGGVCKVPDSPPDELSERE